MEKPTCQFCNRHPAEMYCGECDQYFSNQCFEFFHKNQNLNHKGLQISAEQLAKWQAQEAAKHCPQHITKSKEYACCTCDMAICEECAIYGEHRTHDRKPFDAGCGKIARELAGWVAEYQRNAAAAADDLRKITGYMDSTTENLKAMKNTTLENFEVLERLLADKKAEVLRIIDEMLEERAKARRNLDEVTTTLRNTMEECKAKMADGKERGCERYEYLLKKREVLKSLQGRLKKYLPIKFMRDLRFDPIAIRIPTKSINNIILAKQMLADNIPSINDSSLIVREVKDAIRLRDWVVESRGNKEETFYELLWQGSRDGFTAQAFHSRCDNKGPTLTIIQSTDGQVFGGYTTASWAYPVNQAGQPADKGDYAEDSPAAFVYSLTRGIKIYKQKPGSKGKLESIYRSESFGPTFGSGHEIYICDKCNTNAYNSSLVGKTYGNFPEGFDCRTHLVGSFNFTVKEIEVYAVIVL